MRGDATCRDAGFTLLEVLVALVVLGFILAGLSQGTRYGLRAAETQARTVAARGQLDAVDRALRRLIEQMEPGTDRDGIGLQGGPGRMQFVSVLPAAASALPTPDATVAVGVDGAHRLVLRATPRRPGKPFGLPPPALETELLAGVDHIELAYWPRGPSPAWRTDWTDRTVLPLLVRLRVVFPPGDERHWPDLVASPRRERAAAGP